MHGRRPPRSSRGSTAMRRLNGGSLGWNYKLLVFSGLFSAVVATFVAQTYLLLQPDAPDQTAVILQQISLQLSSSPVNQPCVNSTQPTFTSTPADAATSTVSSSTVKLNSLWFASLILSLSAALPSWSNND
ncbi:hypothetical protein LXA43DRAFT_27150 [Ganoderma leucocontextum]|nr:hypothetical protein LXA43DRAFT_27150 [Ganoderma leucocontextum]